MGWYFGIMDGKTVFIEEEEMMVMDFTQKIKEFVERDEHIFCEVIRMDATRKLIEANEPELLEKVEDPSVRDILYSYMKEAEKENQEYLMRRLPGDAELFQELFSIYTVAKDTPSFLERLFKEEVFRSYYLPQEVCHKALEEVEKAEKIHILNAELFIPCLLFWLRKLKGKEIRLYPGIRAEKGVVLFLKYLTKDHPWASVSEERVNPTENFSPGDLVLMAPISRRIRLRMELPVKRFLRTIEEAPQGVHFFVVLPRNFFTSAAYLEDKKTLASYRVEKLIFFGSEPNLRDIVALVFTKEKAEDYQAQVIDRRKTDIVSRRELETITTWSPEFLLSGDREKILKFFQKTSKVPLGEVAKIRRGYFLRRTEEVKEGEAYTHRLLSVGDIKEGIINPEELAKIKIDEESMKEYRPLKPGDIVISARGTVLKVAEIPPTEEKILPTDSVIVITPKKYPSALLRFFFSSEMGKSLLEVSRRSLRFLSLSPRDLEDLPVPKYPPKKAKALADKIKNAEQERLRKIQEAEEEYRTRIKQIEKELFGG